MKILVVEDEAPIREVIKKYLQLAGFTVEEAGSGEVAILKFNPTIDLVVLDLNLPNRDGLEVCRAIRQKSSVPIIIVTARTEETDELRGLSIGADDYVKKPFSPKVLVARVRSRLRQRAATPYAGGLSVDARKMVVRKGDKEIALTATQFRIMAMLVAQPGRVFTREELLGAVGEDKRGKPALARTIDAHIRTLRKLVETNPDTPRYLQTVIGVGYKYHPA